MFRTSEPILKIAVKPVF